MGSAFTQEQLYSRLAGFLAGAYPGASKRKRIARDFGVSPDTAKGWLTGYAWPRQDTFLAMRAKFGPEFVRFVYDSMDDLDARVARLEREMHLEDARGTAIANAALADARGRGTGVSDAGGLVRPDAAQNTEVAPPPAHGGGR